MSQRLRPIEPTPEENERIKAGIASDPDAQELTEEDIRDARPHREMYPDWTKRFAERQTPDPTDKVAVELSLDRDLHDKLRRDGGDWRERINQTLRRVILGGGVSQ